jgi:hypothetical protein
MTKILKLRPVCVWRARFILSDHDTNYSVDFEAEDIRESLEVASVAIKKWLDERGGSAGRGYDLVGLKKQYEFMRPEWIVDKT